MEISILNRSNKSFYMGPLIIRDITKPPTQAFLGVRHAFLAIENVALVK